MGPFVIGPFVMGPLVMGPYVGVPEKELQIGRSQPKAIWFKSFW
jgi:hypothetical protein